MRVRAFILFWVLLFHGVLFAEIRYWEATLPGGTYMVSVSEIVSVSMHDYFVDGVGQVSEVTIDTKGSAIGRFYVVISPLSGAAASGVETAKQSLERLKKTAEGVSGVKGVDPSTAVVKTYPTTTHAHTVEYRLSDKEELDALFKSARSSLLNATTGTYKVKE